MFDPSTTRALVIVSAHWEASGDDVCVTHADGPQELLFDYSGFPPATYELSYPARGDPALSASIVDLLSASGVPARLDATRKLDHGVFIPLLLLRPAADIPVVQVSLHRSLDAAKHLAIGRALAPLREQGVAIIGSGMATHGSPRSGLTPSRAQAFVRWLGGVLESEDGVAVEKLVEWERSAPHARASHPREEHLLPLLVILGSVAGNHDAPVPRGERVLSSWAMDTLALHSWAFA
jgi:aromatic ring-opening dioxygenase catalytic subunit (LigB family)